jgi:hypothetical protein
MKLNLIKTDLFKHRCAIQVSTNDAEKPARAELVVQFKRLPRAEFEALKDSHDDNRLIYDLIVVGIEGLEDDDGTAISPTAAVGAVRESLEVTAQIVDQYFEVIAGVAAKNSRPSRRR